MPANSNKSCAFLAVDFCSRNNLELSQCSLLWWIICQNEDNLLPRCIVWLFPANQSFWGRFKLRLLNTKLIYDFNIPEFLTVWTSGQSQSFIVVICTGDESQFYQNPTIRVPVCHDICKHLYLRGESIIRV